MTTLDPLLARVEETLANLSSARAAIEGGAMPPLLRARIGADFRKQLDDCKASLERLREGNGPLRDLWASFEQKRRVAEDLTRECMSLLQGAIAREKGADDGLCDIADALVDELEEKAELGWKRFTLPADGESISPVGQIIRVRFPSRGIWSMAAVAHEFGHFACPRVADPSVTGDKSIFASLLGRTAEKRQRELTDEEIGHLGELFADLFGTYVLGPAFVCTCLYLRFNPYSAGEKTSTHPRAGHRAHAMLALLNRMAPTNAGFMDVPKLACEYWNQARSASGRDADQMEKDGQKELDELVFTILSDLKRVKPSLEYRTWPRAQALAASLRSDEEPPTEATLRDLLNGAWLARLGAADVGSRAMRWAKTIAGQRGRGHSTQHP